MNQPLRVSRRQSRRDLSTHAQKLIDGQRTTGAAQTLLRSYGVAPGQRVLVSGNGPLNFQVANELLRAGAEVVALAEAASPPLDPVALAVDTCVLLPSRVRLQRGDSYALDDPIVVAHPAAFRMFVPPPLTP